MDVFNLNKKFTFLIYFILDTLFVGIGMGVPILNIIFGFPVGWYITKRLSNSPKNLKENLGVMLKYSLYTSLITFIWMVIIWVPISTMLINPTADFAHFGIPMILYDPKISFIGWIILMVFISPFLQLLTTVFAAQVTMWRSLDENNYRGE
jgi:hypothetical protein